MAISLTPNQAYDELIDFIASGTAPQNIVAFQPSEEVKLRVAHLIEQEKNLAFIIHCDPVYPPDPRSARPALTKYCLLCLLCASA